MNRTHAMRRQMTLAVALTWLLASVMGCGSGRKDAQISAVRDPLLQDVPKPAGFQLAADRSMARASGRYRIARATYFGRDEISRVKQFYERFMPEAGFELRTWSLDSGEYRLHFESGEEECDIVVSPERMRTRVVVELGPLPEGSPGRDEQPILERPEQ